MHKHQTRLAALERRWHAQQQVVDAQWDEAVFHLLTNAELEAIVSVGKKSNDDPDLFCNNAWVAAHLTPTEQSAIQRVVDLARAAGLQLWDACHNV